MKNKKLIIAFCSIASFSYGSELSIRSVDLKRSIIIPLPQSIEDTLTTVQTTISNLPMHTYKHFIPSLALVSVGFVLCKEGTQLLSNGYRRMIYSDPSTKQGQEKYTRGWWHTAGGLTLFGTGLCTILYAGHIISYFSR